MRTVQSENNRMMNLSQNDAEVFQNPNWYSTGSSHHPHDCQPNIIDITPVNIIHNKLSEPCREVCKSNFIKNEIIGTETEPCMVQNEAINPVYYEKPGEINEAVNSSAGFHPEPCSQPGELNETINPACPNPAVANPIHTRRPLSFNNFGYFVNLGKFVNKPIHPEHLNPHSPS